MNAVFVRILTASLLASITTTIHAAETAVDTTEANAKEVGDWAQEFLKDDQRQELEEALQAAIRAHRAGTPQVWKARVDLAGFLMLRRDLEAAARVLNDDKRLAELLGMEPKKSHPPSGSLCAAHFIMASVRLQQFDLAQATRHFEAVRSITSWHFPGHRGLYAGAVAGLGEVKFADGRYAEAEAKFRSALDIFITDKGMLHPDTLQTRRNLARAIGARGKDATRHYEAYATAVLEGGKKGINYGYYIGFLGVSEAMLILGKPELAESGFRDDEDGAKLKPDAEALFARILAAAGKFKEAEMSFSRAAAGFRKHQIPNHPDQARNDFEYASFLLERGKIEEAKLHASSALELQNEKLRKDHPHIQQSQDLIARLREADELAPDGE